jgi:hypothetical protein
VGVYLAFHGVVTQGIRVDAMEFRKNCADVMERGVEGED